ncbi:group I intron homing endonuclease [Tamlana nanhaiensis]|uniref:Group I intron homing endonuclease n=1 Tax=Neotamlana nanhaiensis TaxID=1382798 RepID=A0A0D7W4W5_9FLAO|nr:DUF4837 family protein [Tamlana nanhaiensis]KJD34089.1 group I intron homing endonuclease [Tamlana nanhaiensis]
MIRYVILSAFTLFFLVSCGNKKKSDKDIYIADATGAINNVSVVMENDLWDGSVGEAVRSVLAKPIYGLPQDEPTFTISQIPPAVFSGFVTKNRTVLKIETGKEADLKVLDDAYAKPQKVIVISGKTKQEIIDLIIENEVKIVDVFRNVELAARLAQMEKSPHSYTQIKEKLGLTIQFPSIYSVAKESDNFFWFRKSITIGHMHLMMYDLPHDGIKRNDSTVLQIIKLRDSIGEKYFRGRLDGNLDANGQTISSFMVTESAYAPYLKETIVDNKPALETKGIWELTNDFMGGPFIDYAIEDKTNNRWVIIEGFAFAPSVEKRNYMLELEAIIKSVKIE